MKKISRSIEQALLGAEYAEFVQIREQYQSALARVREHLADNPLLPIYEKHINSKISVTDKGDVVAIKNTLPPLTELKDRAERYGIDISDLGRSRTKILERLENKNEIATQSASSAISVKGENSKKVQVEKTLTDNDTVMNSSSQSENQDDFDFLDDVEEDPVVVEPTVNRLEQADEIGEQSAEEKALIAQMLSLGSRGGSLDKVVGKVDLEKILVENGGSSNGNGAD